MDIAGRAFRFWQYQHSEEAGFQAMLLRDVQEKLAVVENKHQGQARESLQMQVSNVTLELHGERRRVQALIKSHQEQENEIKRVKSSVIANRRNSLTERGTRSTMHIPQQERLERLETPPHTAQYAPPTPSRIASANIYAMQNASHSNGYNVYNGYERTSAAFGFNRGGPFEAVNKSPVKRISTSSPIKTHALSRKTYLHR
ncbi:hypothetical protein E3P92_00383 [Wallemia ichthyophaga]|uniref:E3 ubiquitin-protein ligase CCNB1IP1 n=1 Tax=Wallemia ichthyophaga TaxID=245174 RepID=A0A4T0KKJ3_WALIC|nr:hypothetical protein E3P91_00739 [Wallemia ichthyophaga]TIA81603.1 hypothetical protein E3P98_01919 [Wallemia ichthyophaga]TIA94210.1 hypothetical protein E3P97_00345 [Wallemia ichthyophaga]TIB03766.1 hypothetical protein E3P95_00448 [Wallemia ichthyophaga]TIB05025.1 hypothetical protein E3P94_00448 [Wallemia ichthyophaga]